MYALAVTNLGTMGYSPFDIGYDAFYKRDSYFEDNAGVVQNLADVKHPQFMFKGPILAASQTRQRQQIVAYLP